MSNLTCYRLCVLASGSLITDIFSCFTLISVSCLHLGQNSGKFSSTVSPRILTRVLFPQIGHNSHSYLHIVLSLLLNVFQTHLYPIYFFISFPPKFLTIQTHNNDKYTLRAKLARSTYATKTLTSGYFMPGIGTYRKNEK